MVVTRLFDAPPRLVFEAWTTPELFKQWWVPKSSGATLLSCEQDIRVGGSYRSPTRRAEHRWRSSAGTSRSCPTPASCGSEESADGAVTTVTFEDKDGRTHLVMRELYSSKEALDIAIEGMDEAMPETFEQLDSFLADRRAAAQSR